VSTWILSEKSLHTYFPESLLEARAPLRGVCVRMDNTARVLLGGTLQDGRAGDTESRSPKAQARSGRWAVRPDEAPVKQGLLASCRRNVAAGPDYCFSEGALKVEPTTEAREPPGGGICRAAVDPRPVDWSRRRWDQPTPVGSICSRTRRLLPWSHVPRAPADHTT